MFSSLVLACMGMHVDFLDFPFPGKPWYCGFISIDCFLVGSHYSFSSWVELLFHGASVGKLLVSSFLDLSLFSLSFILLDTYFFLGSLLESVDTW